VAEPLGNDVDRNAGLEQQSGVRVPQPVEVEGWYRRRGKAVVSLAHRDRHQSSSGSCRPAAGRWPCSTCRASGSSPA